MIFLTGHADVPLAVQSLKAEVTARLAALSGREAEVMKPMLQGQMNKQIASRLGIAMRTVEVHRALVLQKMQVRNGVKRLG